MSAPVAPQFDNSYISLPAQCFSHQRPEPSPEPVLIKANATLAKTLGIDAAWLDSDAGVAMFSGNTMPDGAEPIATAYAGHQFGNWNPQLGDGRAVLLGEVINNAGERFDIQLKGSGRTPYSRGGDGKSPLGPVIREYLISEAMAVLGVPTSRALAAVLTGEQVFRDSALPGAILTRVAKSHIRIGTLQFFSARQDTEALQALTGHAIQRHYPAAANSANPTLALLEGVIQAQASLVAQWQLLGFIHGVMNTDNMLISGETIDYGPCAFMDNYDPATVFSSIDRGGRYAYGNQPGIAHWNLAMLAQALIPLLDTDSDTAVALAQTAVDTFPDLFLESWRAGIGKKLGFTTFIDGDDELAQQLLDVMVAEKVDFTLCFRRLAEIAGDEPKTNVSSLFEFTPAFDSWLSQWKQRLAQEKTSAAERQRLMLRSNPAIIPRNHRVEAAIAAAESGDLEVFNELYRVLCAPFDPSEKDLVYAKPPRPQEVVAATFCGT